MRLRKLYLPLVALLGAFVAVIPSIASSAGPSTATVSGLESIMWSPMEVAITPGGTITFEDTSSRVPHGVVWTNVPETPVCSGVPIDEGRTDWKGKCTFNREGTYEYYCYVHGMTMSGKIFVNAAGTIPTTTETTTTGTVTTSTMPTTTVTTPATTPTTTMPTTTTPTTPGTTSSTSNTTTQPGPPSAGSSAYPGAGSGPGGSSTMGGSSPGGQAPRDSLAGGSLRLAGVQRNDVQGSVQIAQAGSHLEIDLLAASTAVAAGARPAVVPVGRLVRSEVPAGRFSFKLALSKRARLALQRRGRLPVTVKLVLTPPAGTRLTRALTLTVHR
jgi:plastocyanin